jgi:hypothetical protein
MSTSRQPPSRPAPRRAPKMNDVDRHDLDALKELMTAKFEGVENTLRGMQEALKVAASERTKKDAELNEVRQRFVDRITFEQYKESQNRALDAALLAVTEKLSTPESVS